MTHTVHQRIVYHVDLFVDHLIAEAKRLDSELTIEQKTSLLNALGKWVAIKNKLIDGMEGERLDEFRARLKQGATPGQARGRAEPTGGGQSSQRVDREQKRAAGRKGQLVRWGLPPDPASADGVPSGLAEFKKRIPRADDRDDGGARDDAGGDDRGVRPGLLGDF
jgi:hypothetical protein